MSIFPSVKEKMKIRENQDFLFAIPVTAVYPLLYCVGFMPKSIFEKPLNVGFKPFMM